MKEKNVTFWLTNSSLIRQEPRHTEEPIPLRFLTAFFGTAAGMTAHNNQDERLAAPFSAAAGVI